MKIMIRINVKNKWVEIFILTLLEKILQTERKRRKKKM
jgi:hypothetical protein